MYDALDLRCLMYDVRKVVQWFKIVQNTEGPFRTSYIVHRTSCGRKCRKVLKESKPYFGLNKPTLAPTQSLSLL
jgi:hypothetical protein